MRRYAQISRMGSHFLGSKKQKRSFQFVWTNFCSLLKPKPTSGFVVYRNPSNIFQTLIKLPNSFDAQWQMLLWPGFYGWCLSHGVRHDLNARVKYDFCFTRLTDLKSHKISVHVQSMARTWRNFYRKPASHSLNFVKFSFDLLQQLHDLNWPWCAPCFERALKVCATLDLSIL